MLDHIAVYINIGGPILHNLSAQLITTICDESLSLDWSCGTFSPESEHDLLEVLDKDGLLFLCDDHALLDHFDKLETFLLRHHIAFDRYSEAKYEYDAKVVSYRRGMRKPHMWISTQSGDKLLPLAPLTTVLSLLTSGKNEQAHRLLRRLIGPNIEPLQPLSFIGSARPSPSPHGILLLPLRKKAIRLFDNF